MLRNIIRNCLYLPRYYSIQMAGTIICYLQHIWYPPNNIITQLFAVCSILIYISTMLWSPTVLLSHNLINLCQHYFIDTTKLLVEVDTSYNDIWQTCMLNWSSFSLRLVPQYTVPWFLYVRYRAPLYLRSPWLNLVWRALKVYSS